MEHQVTLLLEIISFWQSGENLIINENELLKLYNDGPIKLKLSKYNDVTELACKYVPQEYQWFYSTLKAEENNTINNSGNVSDYED